MTQKWYNGPTLLRFVVVNVLLFIVFTGVVLGLLEIYLRISTPPSAKGSIFEYTSATKRYKVMRKNATITAWGSELRTNSLGFRDNKPTIPPKKPGEYRIIVLGDSFTVSAGVDFDSIYTSLLEAKLKESLPQVNVINLAVGGYNILQYRLVLEEVGLNLNPDMVLVAIFPSNDFSMDTYETAYLRATGKTQPPPLPWYKTLYVYRSFLRKLEVKLKQWWVRKNQKTFDQANKDKADAGWTHNVLALKAISEIARQNNVTIAVAVLPHTWNFEEQRNTNLARLLEYCDKDDIPCVNLLENFSTEEIRPASLRLNLLDSHPNEKYNALVAKYLAPYLASMISRSLHRTPAPISTSVIRQTLREDE